MILVVKIIPQKPLKQARTFNATESDMMVMERSMSKRRYQFRFSDKAAVLPPTSKIDLHRYQNRLFVDEVLGETPEVRVTVNGISLNGRWDIETEDVGEFDYILRLVDQNTSSSVTLTFKDQEERMRAVESLESNRELQHVQSSPKSLQFASILEQKEPPKKSYILKPWEWNVVRWIVGRPELASVER